MKKYYTKITIICLIWMLFTCFVFCQDVHRVKLQATYPDSIQGICLIVEDWDNAVAYFAPCWLKYEDGESFYEVKMPVDKPTEILKFKEDIVIEDDIMLFFPKMEEK